MTHIHLAVKNGQAVGTRLRDLKENSFYLMDGQIYRILIHPKDRWQEGDTVTSLSLKSLEVAHHDIKDIVRPVTLTNIRIEVDAE